MILIDEITVDNVNVKFYEGMDFDLLLNHSRDGSDGFIFCFIESWINEVKSYNRQRKVVSVVDDVNYEEFEWEEINNNYISVYQTIRKKVERKQFDSRPWIGGMSTGAWKIQVGKSDD